MNTSDYLLETGRSDDIAVIDSAGAHTYSDLRRAAAVLAGELKEQEFPQGSRVGILGVNSFFWIAAYLATMKLGHVAVPFSTTLTPEELRRNADFAGCPSVFMSRVEHRRRIDALAPGIAVITEDALVQPRSEWWPESPASASDEDAVLMFTSGTTAGPKAVRVTHGNIQANTGSIVEFLGLKNDDRMLVVLPFFHCFGASLLHTHLRVGGSVALCNTFTFPETVIEMIESENCTGFAGVPSSYQLLMRASSFANRELPGLRHMQQAGGKLPPVFIKEIVAAQPGARFFVMYGQTEATARLSYLPPGQVLDRLGSIGRGIPGVTLRVIDESGERVAPGETGEICARGPSISPGYYRDPQGTAAKFVNGELRTGDLATVDADGFIYVLDRKSDFIKSWGYRVSSQEIEACVLQIPNLMSAAAVGVPDEAAGEAIVVFATTRPGADVTADEILRHCRSRLAKHMRPTEVHFLAEMPLNANGKIAKQLLRNRVHRDEPLWAGVEIGQKG